jgi:plastocyanin
MKKLLALLAVIALAAFGLAACGGDDEDETTAADTATEQTTTGGGPAGATLDVSAPADGSFAFDQDELTTSAGAVTINFDNAASITHDVVVEDQQGNEIGKTDLVSDGSTSTTVELQPGTYTYFCDVPGHREGGMEGMLTVN